jgi:hypothetical protein
LEHHCNFVAQAQKSGGSIIIIIGIGVVWCGPCRVELRVRGIHVWDAYMYSCDIGTLYELTAFGS